MIQNRAPAATRVAWRVLALPALCAGVGCTGSDALPPTIEVQPRDQRFQVRAQGELVPSEAVTIHLPANINMPFDIAWMVPEYSEVTKGQVIVRFDDSEVLSSRQFSRLDVAHVDLQLDTHARDTAITRALIDHEGLRVDEEQDIARGFVDADPLLFSRNEVLDALGDLRYLEVQDAYFAWQAGTHERRSGAERQRIRARRDASQAKVSTQDSALAAMELKSPADGTFVYARLPWGEKLAQGHRVYPGRPVGLLPVRGKVRARVFVPEVDAVGIAPEQAATLRLHSAVRTEIAGSVLSVSPAAIPKTRDDPQRFVVVEVAPDQVDADIMRVGSNLSATILTGRVEGGYLLPAQAVFYNDETPFVYVVDGGTPVMRDVRLGQMSSTLVEVTDGLAQGDRVCLAAPAGGE